MNQPFIPAGEPAIAEVLQAYRFPDTLLGLTRYGQGHINDTFCVVCQPQEGDPIRFILQGISSVAFPNPGQVMENFVRVTDYLREKILADGGDPRRETLSLVPTADGRDYYTDSTGKVWRLMPFIEGTDCFQQATPELFEASARAFGRLQRRMNGFPAESLHEPIAGFHDTEARYARFEEAVQADAVGRAGEVAEEIRFVRQRKADCSVAMQALREGKLPLRVTHNDTKLNNVLVDRRTGEGLCVIDLDTIMPGLSINDFGDSIRFGANHSAEDEKDLTKVSFDLGLYEVYTRGFLEGAGGCLTEQELEYLPWGARLMTLECGIRFLTDYLQGDCYFHTHYAGQNLDRCRTQFKLVRDMEEQFDAMHQVAVRYAK